jgi:rubrerythrin
MEYLELEALQEAILTEKNSYRFYQQAAELVSDERTRQVFELLASEELEHAKLFLTLYPDEGLSSLIDLMKQGRKDSTVHGVLLESIPPGMTLRKALEISMNEEQSCIDRYRVFVNSIRDPKIHNLFSKALSDTVKHYDVIKKEYMRLQEL